jgi:hypothetical protein
MPDFLPRQSTDIKPGQLLVVNHFLLTGQFLLRVYRRAPSRACSAEMAERGEG